MPRADLIYISGLFDYLDDRIALGLTTSLLRQLPPGGLLLIANLTPANEEIALMEVVMDWWMVYRNEEELARLAATASTGIRATLEQVYALSRGRVACIKVRAG